MNKLKVDHLENILDYKILEEETPLIFIDDLAIAEVSVESLDRDKSIQSYITYTVVKEKRDPKTNELVEYEIADNDFFFRLQSFVSNIMRSGNHFIFRTEICNDDNLFLGGGYYHYEYDQENACFKRMEKLNGRPILTKNPDVIILVDSKGSQLYHLTNRTALGNKYTEIEDNDGNEFFVCDIVKNEDGTLSDHLLFDIDTDGNRVSDVYSRNIRDWMKCTLDMPYNSVKAKAILELNKTIGQEEVHKCILKKKNTEEQ